jgi:anti-anti-sigma factor
MRRRAQHVARSPAQIERRVSTPKFEGPAYRTHSWGCPRPSDFAILVMYARDNIHLQLSGDLDADGVDALDDCAAAALAKAPRQLVLDLSGLSSIDRSGVDCLADLLQRSHAVGVHLVLDSPNPAVLGTIAGVNGSLEFSIR